MRLAEQGPVILSGDGAALKAHYYDGVVPRNNMDVERASASIKDLQARVAKENAFLIHGHDPEQWAEIKKAPQYYT